MTLESEYLWRSLLFFWGIKGWVNDRFVIGAVCNRLSLTVVLKLPIAVALNTVPYVG